MTTHPTTLSPATNDARAECADAKTRAAAPGGPQSAGTFWFAGWLFTIGFVHLVWWKALLAIIAWPYFLGSTLAH